MNRQSGINVYKKLLRLGIIYFVLFGLLLQAEARRRGAKDYFLNPQAGVWFGPVTPVGSTAEKLETNLGGGIFFRYNTPLKPIKIGLEGSYQYYNSQSENNLTLYPVYGNLLYRLPIKFALTFQLKAGAGMCNVKINPDNTKQWDPMGMLGFEGSFPAGKYVNIGLRIDYLFIYEGYINGATRNGHVINTGITLYFNIGG